MKVRVDRDLCEANGLCVNAAPTVFELDDDDELTILVDEVPAAQEAAVGLAVKSCPKTALSTSE